jgi:hypothetical protein
MGKYSLSVALIAVFVLISAGAARAETITLVCDVIAMRSRTGGSVQVDALPPSFHAESFVIDTDAQTVNGYAVQNMAANPNVISWRTIAGPISNNNTLDRITGALHEQQSDGGYSDLTCHAGSRQF